MKLHEALEFETVHELKQLRGLIPLTDRSARKSDIIKAIADYLLSADLRMVWKRLSELEVQAIAEAVHNWSGHFDRIRFQAKYGALPGLFGGQRDYFRLDRKRDKEPPSVLPLFFIGAMIPEDLRPRLAQLVSPPEEVEAPILTDEDLPKSYIISRDGKEIEPLRKVATESLVRHDLPAVLRLISQGRITVGVKTGVPGKASVEKLEQVLLGGDWYSVEEDPDLQRWAGGSIRPIRPFAWPLLLQTGGLVKRDGTKLALTPRGKKALSQPIEEVISPLFDRWQAKGRPDELGRIDLIKGQGSKGVRLSAVADRRTAIAAALVDCCPDGGWIEIDELFRQMRMRGHRFEVSHNSWGLYFSDPQYGSLGSNDCGFETLQARYILVYLFEYLATLGMIDIAYTGPIGVRPDYHDAWGADEFLFLSRYDGLRYIRLNALGAYCLGREIEYRPVVEATPSLFIVGADLSLTLQREPRPAESLVLEQIATGQTRDRWQLNPDAVLTQSADPAERERIRDFLQTASDGELPPQAVQLLDTVAERATALSDAGAARLIKCKDKAIAAMLASDPSTAAHCVRAGDRLICVAEPKLKAFRKGLARLGFVLPESFNA